MNGDGGRINGREVAEYKTSHLGHSAVVCFRSKVAHLFLENSSY